MLCLNRKNSFVKQTNWFKYVLSFNTYDFRNTIILFLFSRYDEKYFSFFNFIIFIIKNFAQMQRVLFGVYTEKSYLSHKDKYKSSIKSIVKEVLWIHLVTIKKIGQKILFWNLKFHVPLITYIILLLMLIF